MTEESTGASALPEQTETADAGEFIQEVEDDLDLDYSGVVQTYADALQAGITISRFCCNTSPNLCIPVIPQEKRTT